MKNNIFTNEALHFTGKDVKFETVGNTEINITALSPDEVIPVTVVVSVNDINKAVKGKNKNYVLGEEKDCQSFIKTNLVNSPYTKFATRNSFYIPAMKTIVMGRVSL